MAATYATVAIRNLAEPNRVWEGQFRVDTGATDSLVPGKHLESIGLKPLFQKRCYLADGSPIDRDVTIAAIEVMGVLAGGMVLYGDDDVEPLLGTTALASGGIEVDSLNQTVKLLPAVRL